jgi:hypothetical protein
VDQRKFNIVVNDTTWYINKDPSKKFMDLNTRHKSNIFFTDQKPPQSATESNQNALQQSNTVQESGQIEHTTSLGMIDTNN